jgi:peptide/nickel transport system substrate-binding protein
VDHSVLNYKSRIKPLTAGGATMRSSCLFASTALATVLAGSLLSGSQPAAAAPFNCPARGGALIWAVPAQVPGLDIHSNGPQATRDIVMNTSETLLTRDEKFAIVAELAESYTESPDQLTYTFKLRTGVTFHNGKPMTSADVKASYERFARVGVQKKLTDVASMEAPDPTTFVIRMKKAVPTFLESMSATSNVIGIMPAGTPDKLGNDDLPVGTGPFRVTEWVPDGHVKIARFDGYKPDTRSEDLNGYAGYKVACLDTITYRIVPEAGARVAGLETGEINGADQIPPLSRDRLKSNRNITLYEAKDYWLDYAVPNLKVAPTDNLKFRQAIQAAIDIEEIMEIATDGAFRAFPGVLYPGQEFYSDAGKEYWNRKDTTMAKRLLAESGYKNEKIVLATNSQYSDMNKAAVVMAEQLKGIGVNVEVSVTDWPTFLRRRWTTDYNYFFGAWTLAPNGAVDGISGLSPERNFYNSPTVDPVMKETWEKLNVSPAVADRKRAFADMQKRMFEQAYFMPFGTMSQLQGTAVYVKNYRPFNTTRMSNMYIQR